MTERRSTQAPTREPDGSSVPARLRIVGWIVLATTLGLLAVVLTIRSALMTDVDRTANSDVAQEIDEFRTFADRGRDPATGRPFTTADRLLTLHLERQFPGQGEVLLGYARGAERPVIAQDVRDRYGLTGDPALVEELMNGEAVSGTARTAEGGEFRWGKAVVETTPGAPGGAFLVADFVAPARSEVDRIVRLVVMVCLGGLLLTAAIAYAVAGQILAPVRAVRRAASRITRADLGKRIEVRGRDDVAALSLTFNAMLDRLEQAFRAQQRLASAAGEHLRAPLAVLADRSSSSGDRSVAAGRAAAVLDDLEVLAASEAPGFLSPVAVDLAVLVEQIADEVRDLGSRPWVVEQTAEGRVLLDDVRVRQAVRRLARNALQQESRGGAPLRLGMSLERTEFGEVVEVWVADDGPGLTPERAASVLDRYAEGAPVEGAPVEGRDGAGRDGAGRDGAGRDGVGSAGAGGPVRSSSSGAGLGLAVVRAVADAHDGSAWVETEPGEGARFGLRLPVVRSAPVPREAPDAQPAVVR